MTAVRELDVARAVNYSQERRRQEAIDRRLDSLPAASMADCISSGLSGFALTNALSRDFPTAARSEVYLAVGLAVAILQADLTICQMELAALRQEGRLDMVAA